MTRRYDEQVRQADFFKGVSSSTLESVCAAYSMRDLPDGGFFFTQSEPTNLVYLLVSGRVKMSQLTEDGQQVTMRVIVAGQLFGGVAVLRPDGGYPATAQAMGDCVALSWKGELFKQLAGHDPSLAMKVSELMYGHLEELQVRFRELATERVEQRVARTLLRLVEQDLRGTKEEKPIDLPLSRQEIAEIAGTTLYTVSRLLSEWERQGAVGGGREHIVIRSVHMLRIIAEEAAR